MRFGLVKYSKRTNKYPCAKSIFQKKKKSFQIECLKKNGIKMESVAAMVGQIFFSKNVNPDI